MKDDLSAHHHRQSDQFGIAPFVADDRGGGRCFEAEESQGVSRREELGIPIGEVNLRILKSPPASSVEDQQRVEPLPISKSRRADQHIAPHLTRGTSHFPAGPMD